MMHMAGKACRSAAFASHAKAFSFCAYISLNLDAILPASIFAGLMMRSLFVIVIVAEVTLLRLSLGSKASPPKRIFA